MNVLRAILASSGLVLATGCATSQIPGDINLEYVNLVPTKVLEGNLEYFQRQEVAADSRKIASRDTFEKNRTEFDAAKPEEKTARGVLLVSSAADYIYNQQQHRDIKRDLRLARRAYGRKLILDKRTAETPVVAPVTSDTLPSAAESVVPVDTETAPFVPHGNG